MKTWAVAIGIFLGLAIATQASAGLMTPYGVAATQSSPTAATLTWSDSNGQLTEFVVQRSLKPDSGYKIVAYPSGSARSWLDSGLATGTTYYYRLRAKLNGNTSTLSNVASVTLSSAPADTIPPPMPTGFRNGTVACGRIDAFWTAVSDSGLRGYNVYRNGAFFRQVLAPSISFTDLTVAASGSYTYGVAAYDSAGNQSAQAFITVPAAPCSPAATATPVPTRTATRTATPIRTSTPVQTSTPIRTATGVVTSTPVRTATAVQTSTRTATPTPVPTVAAAAFDPVLVGYVPAVGGAMDVAVASSTAFVASEQLGLTAISAGTTPSITGVSDWVFAGEHLAIGGSRAVVVGAEAGFARLWTLDVGTTSAPTVRGQLQTTVAAGATSGFLDVAVNGTGTLAVAAMGSLGVWVIDLSNPAAPYVRGTYDTPGMAYAVAMNGAGTHAYVADGLQGFRILSLGNPSAPTLAGSLAVTGILQDIAVGGSVAYVIDQTGRLVTIDIASPSAPRQLGALVLGRYAFNVAVEGSRAVVHDAYSGTSYLEAIDVSTAASPRLLGTVALGASGNVKGLALAGGRAYVADKAQGLKIYDVASAPTWRSTVQDDFASRRVAMSGDMTVVAGSDVATNTARLQVIDAGDPTSPEITGELATTLAAGSTSGFLDLATSGTRAVAAMGSAGIWVVDFSAPHAPAVQGKYDTPGIAYAVAVNAAGTIAYVADGLQGLKIVSLSNPSAPSLIGSLGVSGIQQDIAVAGSIVYLVDQTGRLVTVDVATPSAPRQLGALTLGRYAFNVAVEGTRAVVHDAINGIAYLDVIDVSVPATPRLLGSVSSGASGTVRGLAIAGGRLYVAGSGEGLKIYDLATPSAPRLVGTGFVVGGAMDVATDGVMASVADSVSTLSIVDLFTR